MKNFKANCLVGTEKIKKRNIHLKQEKLHLIHEVLLRHKAELLSLPAKSCYYKYFYNLDFQ